MGDNKTQKLQLLSNLLSDLRQSLIELYDKYDDSKRKGTLIFIEELNGYLRVGIDLNFDQNEISFMNLENSFVRIPSNDIKSATVRLKDGEQIRFIDVEIDSSEYYFLTELQQNAKKGKTK